VKVTIKSDGTPRGTSVINTETGEEIEAVSRIEWICDASEQMAKIKLWCSKIPMQVEGYLSLEDFEVRRRLRDE